jgi:signal transduction histidine kinase
MRSDTRVPIVRGKWWAGRESWPLLFIVLAVLVPTGLLLWFMADAIERQSAASRQVAMEAYRGQLRLLRARTDAFWQPYAERLSLNAAGIDSSTAEQNFARLVVQSDLDGAVVFDADGLVVYPRLVSARRVTDADQLLAMLQGDASRSRAHDTTLHTLSQRLNDYSAPMPSAQRLFLMGELGRLTATRFPTEDALRLSTQFLESGTARHDPGAFRPTLSRDVWALTSTDRRVVGLYRTARLQAMLDGMLTATAPTGVRFVTYPPEAHGDPEAIAMGPSLPGWQVSFAVLDSTQVDAAAYGRLSTYLWVGFAGIATIAVLGVAAGQMLRRQLHLARLKTDLTAAVSHELRAPLAAARVLVDGLLADETFNPVKAREYLHLIAGEHARLSRVVENFLTFARLERSRERFVLAPASASAIVEASVAAIRERTPANCDLRVDVPRDLPPIMADTDALETALINLLDNAFKFTPEHKEIVVSARADEGRVTFAVQDNGIGIPAREQRRIFRRFYRVDQRLARETSGVGLGLSIVSLIVRAHGGEIDVQSEPGAGSTFVVRIPIMAGGSA